MSDKYVRYCLLMKGAEFLRRVQRLARRRGWTHAWYPNLGKGSHGKLFVNGRQTTLRYLKGELTKGSLHGLLRQLDITLDDLLED